MGKRCPLRREFLTQRRRTGFHASNRGLIPCPAASVNPPVCRHALMVAIRGEIALRIILGKEIIGTPVTAKDHHLMVGTGVTIIPEGIVSHVIGNPEGALLHSDHSVKIVGIGTLLGGLLFRIGNMGWGVHILNTPIL